MPSTCEAADTGVAEGTELDLPHAPAAGGATSGRRRRRGDLGWLRKLGRLVRLLSVLGLGIRPRTGPRRLLRQELQLILRGYGDGRLRPWRRPQIESLEELIALQQPERLPEQPASLLRRSHRCHRGRQLLLLCELLHQRSQDPVHPVLHRRPGRIVAVEVGLVHGQRQPRNLDLAGQPCQAGDCAGPGCPNHSPPAASRPRR